VGIAIYRSLLELGEKQRALLADRHFFFAALPVGRPAKASIVLGPFRFVGFGKDPV
jgi:hypothetical protein